MLVSLADVRGRERHYISSAYYYAFTPLTPHTQAGHGSPVGCTHHCSENMAFERLLVHPLVDCTWSLSMVLAMSLWPRTGQSFHQTQIIVCPLAHSFNSDRSSFLSHHVVCCSRFADSAMLFVIACDRCYQRHCMKILEPLDYYQ